MRFAMMALVSIWAFLGTEKHQKMAVRLPWAPRIMPTIPVRPTSTSPRSRISVTNVSILSGAPVSSKMKLSVVVSTGLGAKDVGQSQSLDAALANAGHFDQRQFARHMRAHFGKVDHLVYRHQSFELGVDLVDLAGRAVGDDGDPAHRMIFGDVGHGQAVDVVTARGEQAGDLGQNTGLVIDRDGQDVAFLGLVLHVHHDLSCSSVWRWALCARSGSRLVQTSALAASSMTPATRSP